MSNGFVVDLFYCMRGGSVLDTYDTWSHFVCFFRMILVAIVFPVRAKSNASKGRKWKLRWTGRPGNTDIPTTAEPPPWTTFSKRSTAHSSHRNPVSHAKAGVVVKHKISLSKFQNFNIRLDHYQWLREIFSSDLKKENLNLWYDSHCVGLPHLSKLVVLHSFFSLLLKKNHMNFLLKFEPPQNLALVPLE